ncbi:MAG: acyl-CoA dehydrogenase family protein [Solirubrobacterales bacterium]|nr:acyl-CoA dehydrogenase family protein [Solirubrobacterales bacterium]
MRGRPSRIRWRPRPRNRRRGEAFVSSNVSERQAREVAEAAREAEWKLPSFGKELFMGNFRLDLIHPQPRLDPQAVEKGERFLGQLREFLEAEVDPLEIEGEAKIPEHVIDGLKRLGALGMKVSEEYGGLGLSQVYYNRALALAGVWHAALSGLLSAHQSIGVAEPLRLFGTEEQKRKWLPLVARDKISAFLLTEPDVGSDPARLASSATPTDGGYVLNGRKLWATNGAIADIVVVMAQVPKGDGHRGGISAFVLPYDLEGVTVEHRNAFMGLRGIENSVTRLENVFIPEENRIGREGEGLKIALTTLNTGRLALPAICVGQAKWATKVAREWSSERVQWGRPIGKHDAVAQKLAFIAGSAFGLEAMLDVSSRLADSKAGDIRIEAAMAKLYASELGWTVLDELIQVRGGRGYETAASLKARGEKPVPAEQALRDMRINRIFEGSTEIMHLLIAREAVDQHLQVAGDLLEPGRDVKRRMGAAGRAGKFYSTWLPRLAVGRGQIPRSYDEFGTLAPYVRYIERASRKLARAIFFGMTRWQAKLERRQTFLGRIVDIGAELFAMAAAAAYADTIAREQPERRAEAQELAALFCAQAKHRAETLFGELWNNVDDANRQAAAKVLDGSYRWLEEGIADPAGEGPMIPEEVKESAAAVAG